MFLLFSWYAIRIIAIFLKIISKYQVIKPRQKIEIKIKKTSIRYY